MSSSTKKKALQNPKSLLYYAVMAYDKSGHSVEKIGIRELTAKTRRYLLIKRFKATLGLFLSIPDKYFVIKKEKIDVVATILNAGPAAVLNLKNILDISVGKNRGDDSRLVSYYRKARYTASASGDVKLLYAIRTQYFLYMRFWKKRLTEKLIAETGNNLSKFKIRNGVYRMRV